VIFNLTHRSAPNYERYSKNGKKEYSVQDGLSHCRGKATL
jgi:hypothetical protein